MTKFNSILNTLVLIYLVAYPIALGSTEFTLNKFANWLIVLVLYAIERINENNKNKTE